jgi:adenylate kinase
MNTGQLFGQTSFIPRDGLRVVVTGQVGIDKQPFLEQVIQLAGENGIEAKLFNVGEMMYKESPDVAAGRILDLPISRLNAIRRAVFRDILTEADRTDNIIVNTHATFRWRHGLFPAFDHDLILRFAPNMFITLVDNVDSVHLRLIRDHNSDHSLKDLLVWREEEILATEVLATVTRGFGCFYMAARGQTFRNVESFSDLFLRRSSKKYIQAFR